MVRALALQARGHWFESSCFHQRSRGLSPRLFAVRNSPLCGGTAARLTAEPVTSSLLTLTERRRAEFPYEFSLTLRRTAPFVRIPLISPVCAFAFPFAIPSSLRSSLRVQLFPPKKPRFVPRLFAVRNSPLCGGAAARLTAEPVTVTADAVAVLRELRTQIR